MSDYTSSDLPALPPHPRDDEPFASDDVLGRLLASVVDHGGYTIREWREISRCQSCGHPAYNPDTDANDSVETPCEHGCCHVFRCAQCGHYDSGWGPAGCPCDDGI